MVPFSWWLTIYFLLLDAAAAFGIGALTGWLIGLAIRNPLKGVWKDGFLGSAGFFVGFLVPLLIPWHNTITYRLNGGTIVTSTADHYQHPLWSGIAVAILFPVLNELYRWRKREPAKLS